MQRICDFIAKWMGAIVLSRPKDILIGCLTHNISGAKSIRDLQ